MTIHDDLRISISVIRKGSWKGDEFRPSAERGHNRYVANRDSAAVKKRCVSPKGCPRLLHSLHPLIHTRPPARSTGLRLRVAPRRALRPAGSLATQTLLSARPPFGITQGGIQRAKLSHGTTKCEPHTLSAEDSTGRELVSRRLLAPIPGRTTHAFLFPRLGPAERIRLTRLVSRLITRLLTLCQSLWRAKHLQLRL